MSKKTSMIAWTRRTTNFKVVSPSLWRSRLVNFGVYEFLMKNIILKELTNRKIVFQWKAGHLQTGYRHAFLLLWPWHWLDDDFVYKCVLDIHKIYPHTENVCSRARHSKFRIWTARHSERLFWSCGDLDLKWIDDLAIRIWPIHSEDVPA